MTGVSSRIVLLGCGYTLRRLARRYSPDRVVLIVRSDESRQALLQDGFPFVHAVSTFELDALQQVFSNYSSIQCVIDSVPPGRRASTSVSGTSEAALSGVRNTITVAEAHGSVRRLIYLSTTGVYGVTDGSIVSESTAVNPASPQATARLASENLYRSSSIASTIIRIAAIYGPGRGIGTALQTGRYKMLEEGAAWSNRIQVEDLAALIHAVVEADAPPAIVCASDGNPARQREVVDYYCRTFALPFPEKTSRRELIATGAHTRLSNQRVQSTSLSSLLPEPMYPDYIAGAHTEFC